MAYVMTYNSLIVSLNRWVKHSASADFQDELPRLIDTTERKVARALKTLLSIRYADDTMTPNNNLIAKPARWLETVSLQVRTGSGFVNWKSLDERDYEYLNMIYPNQNSTGEPRIYSDFEFYQFIIGPTPDLAYPFRLAYYERPSPLGDTNQQNWLTQNAPDLLLYGTLLESAPFLRADERIAMWSKEYDRKLIELTGEDQRRTTPRSEKTEEK